MATAERGKRQGQEIQAFATLAKDSPTRYIMELMESKRQALGIKAEHLGAKKSSDLKSLQDAINKTTISKGEVISALKSLEC